MPTEHTVKNGDSITSLAEKYGLFETTIWMHADNAKLREKRSNKNILAPGDVVIIPDKTIHQESCAAGSKYKFKRKGVPAKFRVQLFDQSEARANQSYRFDIDGKLLEGTTDDDGILVETVSPNAQKGILIIGPDNEKIEFEFGTLQPTDSTYGAAQRLTNLGFYSGKLDVAEDDDYLIQAIKKFQVKNDLPCTGALDSTSKEKLTYVHDIK